MDQKLLEQIAAAPDDDGAYLVAADALQQVRDPRGDLIVAQHLLAHAEPRDAVDLALRAAKLLDANPSWQQPMKRHAEHLEILWKRGFVESARVRGEGAFEALRALLATPCVPYTLAELHIPADDAVLDLLVARWPPALRRLTIGELAWDAMFEGRIDASALQRTPIEKVTLIADQVRLGWTSAPPNLKRLGIRSPRFVLPKLAFPDVTMLHLWVADVDVAALTRFPKLVHLGLIGTRNTERIARELAGSTYATIDLSGGTLTSADAVIGFGERVNVARNLLPKEEAARLQKRSRGKQRKGRGALTERAAVRTVERVARRKAEELDPDKLEAWLDVADPEVKRELVWEAAESLEPAERAAMRARVWRPDAASCISIGSDYDTAGELFLAELWLWKAAGYASFAGDDDERQRALSQVGTLRMRRGDAATAAELLASFAETASSKRTRAWALRQQGNSEAQRSEYAKAEVFYRDSLALYREIGSTDDEAIVLSELSVVHWWRQDLAGAEQILRESIALRAMSGAGTGSAYYNLGAILNGAGRLDDSRAAAEQALALFVEAKHEGGQANALSLLGELAQRQFRYADARALLERGLKLLRKRGERRSEGVTLGNLARLCIEEERYDEARTLCEDAIAIHRDCGNKFNEGMQLMYLIDIALIGRDLEAAAARAEEAIGPLEEIGHHQALAAVRLRQGIGAQLARDAAGATRYYDAALVDADRSKDAEMRAWVLLWRAVQAAVDGDRPEAASRLAEARAVMPGHSVAGQASVAMATAVISTLLGSAVPIPDVIDWDTRMFRSVLER